MSTAGLVRKITKATEVPVIAAGGVGVADDVRELLDAGATRSRRRHGTNCAPTRPAPRRPTATRCGAGSTAVPSSPGRSPDVRPARWPTVSRP